MRAYNVTINGKHLCFAGIGKSGSLSANVTYLSERDGTDIEILGLVESKKLYVRWSRRRLTAGDEVRIRVVDRKSVAKFKKIRRVESAAEIISSRKRMVRKMAKECGRTIDEKREAGRP